MPTWHFVEPYPPVGWTGHQDTLAAPWGASAGTSALVSSSHFPLLAAKTVMSVTSTHWSYCAPDRRPTPLFVRSFVPQPPCKTGTIPIHVHRGRSRGSLAQDGPASNCRTQLGAQRSDHFRATCWALKCPPCLLLLASPAVSVPCPGPHLPFRVSSPFSHSARVALGRSSTSMGRGDPPACGHQAAVPHPRPWSA